MPILAPPMPTVKEQILKFINHRYVTWAQVAYDLYPTKEKERAKYDFYDKLTNRQGRKFSQKEEERILELYEEFKKSIEDGR